MPRRSTFLGAVPVIMNPAMPALSPVRTPSRVDRLSALVGGVGLGVAVGVCVGVGVGLGVGVTVGVDVDVGVAVGVGVGVGVGDGVGGGVTLSESTKIVLLVPVIEALRVSVAVIVWFPSVWRLALKVPNPLVNVLSGGREAWLVLVKWTVPV
jgi:hypothetical protein